MDRLVNARTLAAIVDRVERAIGLASAAAKPVEPAPEPSPPVPVASNGSRNGKHRGGTQRLLLKTVEAPLPGAECGLMSGGTVLITEDDGGVAEAVARAIQARGWQTVMIGGRNSRLDWTSPDAVDRAIRQARRAGPFAGLVHLSPLQAVRTPELDATLWAHRMRTQVTRAFPAGETTGVRPRARGRSGRCLPDRGDRHGRPVCQRWQFRERFLSRPWRRRGHGQDDCSRVAHGAFPRHRSGRRMTGRRPWPIG